MAAIYIGTDGMRCNILAAFPSLPGFKGRASEVTLVLCQKLLGLMAAAVSAIKLSILHMRLLQAVHCSTCFTACPDTHTRNLADTLPSTRSIHPLLDALTSTQTRAKLYQNNLGLSASNSMEFLRFSGLGYSAAGYGQPQALPYVSPYLYQQPQLDFGLTPQLALTLQGAGQPPLALPAQAPMNPQILRPAQGPMDPQLLTPVQGPMHPSVFIPLHGRFPPQIFFHNLGIQPPQVMLPSQVNLTPQINQVPIGPSQQTPQSNQPQPPQNPRDPAA
ncbi:uncharacterized protein LOC121326677 [Polyodon spathula]|uniref:uncharacterized protein LOC121326677 n=1 Tax=Polyodon spathula TaxID=7913 RepID=UPI001B7ECBBF|nr:uncharacterized protein LOC121326677 [Polyodon spathula]